MKAGIYFIGYIFLCLYAQAGMEGRFISNDEVLDLSELYPVQEKGDFVRLTGGMKRQGTCFDEIAKTYLQTSADSPEESRLTKVKILDLSHNALSNDVFQGLTGILLSRLQSLTNLQVLVLSHNKIDAQPA